MTSIAVLLLAAAVGFWISHVRRIPSIPLLILLGVMASWLLPIPEDFLEEALILGVTVVVFVAGVEMNPRRVGRFRATAAGIGFLQFFVLGLAGVGSSLLLGFGVQTAMYLGLAVAASSTLVVLRLLQRRAELYTPLGRTVMGVLLLQDLLVILFIPVVTRMGDGALAILAGLAGTVGLMVLAGLHLRYVAPRLIPKVADDEEFLLLVVLSILFLFLAISHLMDLPLIGGAFLAGVALSPFPVAVLVRGQVTSLGDFFSALFFTALGASLTLPASDEFLQALALAALVVIVTPPLVILMSERAGFSARAGIRGGLLLSQTSEFSLVIGLQGMLLGQIDSGVFSVIALFTVGTMMLTPVLCTSPVVRTLMRIHPFKEEQSDEESPEGHILLAGCGVGGITLLEMLVGTPYPVWVVDDDPAVADRIREAGFPVIRGDATDVEVLRSAGAHQARLVVSMLRRPHDAAPLLALARDRPVVVRTTDPEDDAWVEERGGVPVSYSEAGASDFLRWFQEEEATAVS